MYTEAKEMVSKRGYSSISELIREALRHVLYPNLTENGFTPEFEDEVLRIANSSTENDTILETQKDIERHFLKLHKKIQDRRHVKS